MLLHLLKASDKVAAVCLAIAASAALLLALTLDGDIARAQADITPTQTATGPVVVWETAIPEDWPEGQTNHIIITVEVYAGDEGELTFELNDSADAAKFSLLPAGVNDAGNHVAHLVLKDGETLDYETQDAYSIGVEVSSEDGATTDLLIRLRIIDVDETEPSPSPTPSPAPTPTDPCIETIRGKVNIVRSWDDASCLSENRQKDAGTGDYYARFFTFTLGESATVSISLKSEVDTYLYLMSGTEKNGTVIAQNDDAVEYLDFNAGIEGQELDAGDYTIDATAYDAEQRGSFRLVVSGLPGSGGPQLDCSTGGAVSDAEESPELAADCETLLDLRDALAGAALLNWAADTPIADWDGITVGGSPMRVTELALDERGLNGELPAALGRLSALKILSLSGNSLRGAIPSELGGMKKLETLALNDNRLSGSIPAELGGVHELRTLSLSNNRLSGEIPAELGSLPKLEALKLGGNSLSGCIPATLQKVADNDLAATGLEACPSGLCSTDGAVDSPDDNAALVADCNALLEARDRLSGSASLNWSASLPIEDWEGVKVGGSSRRVIHLALNQKGLTGNIPAALGRLSHLTILQLSDNELWGPIPAELGRLSGLELIVLSENELNGEIPPELGGLASVSHLSLSGNELSGAIPAELSGLAKLRSLHIDDNRLSGEIPGELGSLPNLRFVYLDDNDLSGELPPALGNSMSLEVLSVDGNKLTGTIPREYGDISSLKQLSLESNMLSGEIPPELGRLNGLEILSLANNRLGGEIPAQLGAIANLRSLWLHSNNFTGCIPKELKDVARNDLAGLGLEFCGEGKCAAGAAVPNPSDNHGLVSDCNALLSARDALMGSASLNWSTELAIGQWDGVATDGSSKRVTELNLSEKGLDGEIPAELANLTNLKVLSLSDNELTGTIPPELVKLSNMETLSLDDNLLSGQIPHELARLPKLEKLHISGNQLTGCIPDRLDDVQENDLYETGLILCEEVDCSSGIAIEEPAANSELVADCETLLNMRDILAGDIFLNWSANVAIEDWDGITVGGATVGSTTKRVTRIELNDKGLNGKIPSALGGLAGLETLSLSKNSLTGQIPLELALLANLKKLLLDDNSLTGRIEPGLSVLNGLDELKLSGNNLTECIPEKWREIADNDLDKLGLEYCAPGECSTGTAVEDPESNPGLLGDCNTLLAARDALKGDGIIVWSANTPIAEWHGVTVGGSPMRVTRLELGPSNLNGVIPAELGRLSGLEALSLNDSRLKGTIPSELGELSGLKTLSLSGNNLDGAIPASLGGLTALERLSLSNNRLSGSIPIELGNLTSLEYLSLTENSLSGSIPRELGNLTGLRTLYLSNNRLEGAIPSEIGDLTELSYLRLSDNSLSGSIPAALGSLSDLRHLHLSRNMLSGTIPAELGSLTNLEYLHLSDNEISGRIPAELGNLSNLSELYLSGNALTGPIPSELGNLSNLVQLYLPGNELSGDIPVELGNLSNLVHLYVGGNQLTGCVPAALKGVQYNDLSLLGLPDC